MSMHSHKPTFIQKNEDLRITSSSKITVEALESEPIEYQTSDKDPQHDKNFNCPFCQFKTTDATSINEHVNKKHPHKCNECSEVCTSDDQLEEHTHEKHGPKHGEPCPGCDNTIFLMEFSEEKCVGFICNLCKFELKIPDHIKDVFIDNKKTNIPDKVYICGECKLAFPSKEKINEHKHENIQKLGVRKL